MSHEDDGDEDPQLRSLRAVWLAMPDEDPPERGLGELMAAARVKAEALAQPPWWRRALETMRRPPALAFATVVVLIGGAVVIGTRHDELSSEPTARARPTPHVDVAPGAPPVTPESPAAPGASGGAPATGRAALDPAASTPAPLSRAGKHAEAAPPTVAPVGTAKHRSKAGDSFATKADGPIVNAPDPVAPITGALPTSAPQGDAEVRAKADAVVVAGSLAADERASPAGPPAPTLGQLALQCRAAATRGDCAAVHALVARIARQDPAFYRDHVAKDAALARCLAAQ